MKQGKILTLRNWAAHDNSPKGRYVTILCNLMESPDIPDDMAKMVSKELKVAHSYYRKNFVLKTYERTETQTYNTVELVIKKRNKKK